MMEVKEKSREHEPEIEKVWQDYKEIFEEYYKPRKFTHKRQRLIKVRLETFTAEELRKAMLAIADDDFIIGNNSKNKFYAKPSYCFRSDDKVEEWLNQYENQKDPSVAQESKNKFNIEVNEDMRNLYKKYMSKIRSLDYQEYLQTEHWQHFKLEAIRHAGHKCQICNKDDCNLNVHHNNYDNRGRETFNDVIVVCDDCHNMIHNK